MKTEREEEGMKGAEEEGQRCSARPRSAQERRGHAVSLQHKGEMDEQAVAWGSQEGTDCSPDGPHLLYEGGDRICGEGDRVGEGNPCEGIGEILEQQP